MAELTRVTPKMQAATELLEAGLQLYFDGKYLAALHLAGGADDVFGGYVTRGGTDSAFESMKAGALRIAAHLTNTPGYQVEGRPATAQGIADVMNYARNRTKHLNKEGDDEVLFDPKREAEDMLGRALTNYYDLMGRLPLDESELMRRFNHEHL
jgi:hypothetical protein